MRHHRSVPRLPAVGALVALLGIGACSPGPEERAVAVETDTAFSELQSRGGEAMGVDQYASSHLFDALPDGGRIELQRDDAAPEDVDTIRGHLREIAESFARGDFSDPAFVHAREMPGTRVMTEKGDAIEYVYRELPRGGEVRITTADPEAVEAVHAFMASQRGDHRAAGHH